MAMAAAEAFAAESELVVWDSASGRIAAEIIAPAPPGVPRLIPGQRITDAHVRFLHANVEAGVFILDPADEKGWKVRVVKAKRRHAQPGAPT